tara:strand:+ start:1411 stop:2166 length:756 start_codon:yes stop_codon:yes gene_type:complete
MNQINKFNRDGYLLIKKGINKKECQKLIKKTIIPILHSKGIYLTKHDTWNNDGELLYGNNYGHIIDKNDKYFKFKSLFNSKKLNNILNLFHSRRKYSKINKWDYKYLAKEGLGWIHLRYPFIKYINNTVKYSINNFHLDGLINNEIDYKQSVIILPFITTVKKNQGGTVVLPGSHKIINEHILRYNYKTNKNIFDTINKKILDNENKVIDITGEQGDILIMHPHLIHSSSYADINSNVRITFNLSTEITKY